MQKKKSQAKLNLPSVGVKPTQTSKNYTSKSNINKCREVDDKNIYFEMPSIHQNDLTLKAFIQDDRPLHKLQMKILRHFQIAKESKLAEEWQLYMKKSQIINSRSIDYAQLEDYLTKTIYRLVARANEAQQNTSFSLNRSLRSSCNLESEIDPSNIRYNRTYLEDRVLNEGDSKAIRQSPNKSMAEPIGDGGLGQQNVLLEKKAELYERRIDELSRSLAKFEEKENEGVGQKDVSNELMQAIAAKNKYKYESQVKSMHIESLSREAKASKEQASLLHAKFAAAQAQLQILEAQNKKCREYLKYRELWQMASQQSLTWQGCFRQERQERQRGIAKIKLLKDKNKQLLNYFNMSNAVNPDQEEDKQDLDKIIKEFKEWLMIISVPKVATHAGEQGESQQRMGEEVNVKLLRPNFYIFFEAFENTLLMEKNIINIRPIEYNFFLKIRCIFDALFRNFQLARSYKDYSSFPEFVVGFLQKYQVHPETGRVQYRRKPIQNEQKITFLVNLFNKNFCNTWQCEIFKNFLFQNYYLDEIYFFLDCRNQFNSGTPASHCLGSVDPISYVKLSKALKVVGKQLAPYENYIIQRVKNILRAKKKVKYGQAFVDKHFVLKLLLEVYSLERAKSERVFESSFTSKMKKSYITFGDCHHFLATNFTFLTSPQIAQIYRQLYTLSSGHVTHKALHYLCGSKGLFIPLMLEKRAARTSAEKSLGADMLLLDVQNVVMKMVGQLEQFGEQSFMGFEHSLNTFMRQLDFFKLNKSAFYHRLLIEKCNVLRINTLLELAASYQLNPGEIMQESEVQSHMIQLHSLLHQTDTQVHILARQRDRRSKAWRMLVRNFKIRIQQSILQFQKVNEDEIKKLREQIQRTNLNNEQMLQAELERQKPSQTRIIS